MADRTDWEPPSAAEVDPIVRLVSAVEDLLQNMIDVGDYGPETDETGESYPHDEDGDPWFHDVWELNEALPHVAAKVSLYGAAPYLLEACKAAWVFLNAEPTSRTLQERMQINEIAQAAIAKAEGRAR